jgi:hypothetical protein
LGGDVSNFSTVGSKSEETTTEIDERDEETMGEWHGAGGEETCGVKTDDTIWLFLY